jgi:hypothetical protein
MDHREINQLNVNDQAGEDDDEQDAEKVPCLPREEPSRLESKYRAGLEGHVILLP